MKQHSPRFLQLTQTVKKRIKEISPQALKSKLDQKDPLFIIDVREDTEWANSEHIPGAVHLSKGIIERDIEKKIPDITTPILVYCSGGFRCALVADSLQNMGYTQVTSLDGGLAAWTELNYPLQKD